MGGKQLGRGQHFYFCFALLIFVSGCALLAESARDREMREALARGNHLFAHGDYEGSLKAFQNVLVLAQDKPPGDVASYNMGLLYAHPQYDKRDIRKALGSFKRVIARYPESPWVAEAKVWVGVLNETAESKQEIEKWRELIERSRQEIEKNRLAVERSRQEIEKTRVELEKSKQEIEKSKQVIEKSKQIDIEIEQKRRDRGR
jgi:outer membrane protein assembly factor BamD (BamD/ComL family)